MNEKDIVLSGLRELRKEISAAGLSKVRIHEIVVDAIEYIETQGKVIDELYNRYDELCKEIREKYESDDVCGLCQYDGAFVGESGDWMNECPGFETNECFCMKNSIRKMCGQPLIEEP